ncbi:2-methoxy-6-polyprenyl-1,4-benzoquinol methylase, mitochondrial isoform X2 [Drosophila ficusphila]|uniref:2-methoxy-6-polyprenyl-1,4-benzoquinol methylase, mitochondrial isoform X2 n=1 Tax=Drosophila ficusphila TaxID=30025 RepID=UPI0007E830CB|nr:2-methoxy-6-polyprenyl-1,4-benzoquinol methylase, mitochondrial isoform X2 [Drosophila ficusphila]
MQSTRSIRLLSLARRFAHIRTAAQSAQEPTGSGKDSSKATSGSEQTTHFGFQTVKESEKEQKVHEVFEQVANSYDMMNDAMSLGIHRVWKDIFVERLGPTHGMRLLDMAGGTGDITFRYLRYLANQPNPQQRASHVTVSDINQHMLDVGEERAKRLGLTTDRLPNSSIAWQCADAEKLPFKDESFTAYTIAFGIRNCTHVDKVLSEAYRVLQPGGRFMCLEFSHLTNETMQWLYDQYSFQVIPPMGQLLAGQWQAYQYLVESIRRFPKQEQFKRMIEQAGFAQVSYENLTFGVVSIHSGFKL